MRSDTPKRNQQRSDPSLIKTISAKKVQLNTPEPTENLLVELIPNTGFISSENVELSLSAFSSRHEAEIPLRSTIRRVAIKIHSEISANYFSENSFVAATLLDPLTRADLVIDPAQILSMDIENLPIVRVFGSTYADRHWTELTTPTKPEQTKKQRSKSRRGKGDIDTQVEPNKSGRQKVGPSLWDLIYVVLKPPITLEASENILLPHRLFPYQITGIDFLKNQEGALLADDMGTGKTVMTCVAIKLLMQKGFIKRTLILCPPAVLREWSLHLAEWTPELHSILVRGPQAKRQIDWLTQSHVYVTTYDTLKSDMSNKALPQEKFGMFDLVVLDEAHHIKNFDSLRARAVRKLNAKRRWALTGTPVQNKIEDLYSLFEFLHPGLLDRNNLTTEQVTPHIKSYMLRRRKHDVMPDLPPKQKQELWMELDTDQRVAYEKAEKIVHNELNGLLASGDRISKKTIFAKIIQLKQICNFAPDKAVSPKTIYLKDQIEDIIDSGNKVIVFSQYIPEGIAKLEVALHSYGIAKIVGTQSDNERNREIERFKRSQDTPVLLVSIKSGGEGLNLTEATYVIHFDHWWNPAVMWQAEDRVHRRGQLHGVNVYSYWMLGTIDERIHAVLKRKGLLIENIVDGNSEGQIDSGLTDDDWLEMIGLKQIKVEDPLESTTDWTNMSLEELRQHLLQLSPDGFEWLVKQLMEKWGYSNVRVTGKSGDDGIDVLSTRNTSQGVELIAAQCKRYQRTIGVEIARDFFGAMHDKNITKAYLITTSDFSTGCIDFCQRNGIDVLSGLEIAKEVKKFGLNVVIGR